MTQSHGSVSAKRYDRRVTEESILLTLNTTATDATSGMGYMMLANDLAFTGAYWRGYSPTVTWYPTAGTGMRTVYVKYKDKVGENAYHDSDGLFNQPQMFDRTK